MEARVCGRPGHSGAMMRKRKKVNPLKGFGWVYMDGMGEVLDRFVSTFQAYGEIYNNFEGCLSGNSILITLIKFTPGIWCTLT